MPDEKLQQILPKLGDRIAVLDFSKRLTAPKNKISIIEKIKQKLEKEKNKNTTDLSTRKCNPNQKKKTRYIELGWLCCIDGKNIVQVRAKQGGGTRKICMPQSSTMDDVEKKAINLFFPNGISSKGPLCDFEVSVLDFQHNPVQKDWKLEQIFDWSSMTRLRFYLTTTRKHPLLPEKQRKIKKQVRRKKIVGSDDEESSSEFQVNLPEPLSPISKYVWPEHNPMSNPQNDSFMSTSCPIREYLFSYVVNDNDNTSDNIDGTTTESISKTEKTESNLLESARSNDSFYNSQFDVNLESSVDLTYDEDNFLNGTNLNTNLTLPTLEESAEIVTLEVQRQKILDTMLEIYEDSSIIQKKLKISFKDEQGEDFGGLMKELFHIFWEDCGQYFFSGENRLIPFLSLQRKRINKHKFGAIGRILIHTILLTQTLPSKLSRTLYLQLGNLDYQIPVDVYRDDFLSYITNFERSLIEKAQNNFSSLDAVELQHLSDLFQLYGLYENPSEKHFNEQILTIAEQVVVTNPLEYVKIMKDGIPLCYEDFFVSLDALTLKNIFYQQIATPKKVIDCLETEEDLTHNQASTLYFLKTFIFGLSNHELSKFLQFVTGSDHMPLKIKISFVTSTENARNPVAHTCSNLLELPTCYHSYQDFANEFRAILNSDYTFTYTQI